MRILRYIVAAVAAAGIIAVASPAVADDPTNPPVPTPSTDPTADNGHNWGN